MKVKKKLGDMLIKAGLLTDELLKAGTPGSEQG